MTWSRRRTVGSLVGLLLLASRLMSAQTTGSPEPVEVPPRLAAPLQAAENAYAAGEWGKALQVYERLVSEHPSLLYLWFRIGRCASKLEAYPRAIHALERARDLAPESPLVQGELADVLRRAKRYDDAEAAYTHAIESAGPQAHSAWHVGLALIDVARTDFVAAERRLRGALHLDPDQPAIHYNLAETLFRLERPAAADDEYVAALERDPEFALAHFGRGRIAERGRDFTSALAHYTRAAEINSEEPSSHYARARMFRRLGRLPDAVRAVADYQRAVATRHLRTARANIAQGRWGDAARQLQIAHQTDPTFVAAALERGKAYVRLGEPGRGEAALLQLLQQHPGERDAYRALAEARLQQGNLSGAEDALSEALDYHPDWAVGLWLRGVVRARRGADEAAEGDLRAATLAAPEATQPRAALARFLAERNRDLDEAFELAVEVMQAEPTPSHRGVLALVYLQTGYVDQARLQIERAHAEAPTDTTIRALRTAILRRSEAGR